MTRLVCTTLVSLFACGMLSAAEPEVRFHDGFEEKLGEGWSWLREDADAWRIKDGALEIRVQPGVARTVRNALLRAAPAQDAGKVAAEVTITFLTAPTRQYEQAGITWYHDKKPVFKLVHEQIDGKTYIIPGRKPTETKTIQLRLVLDGEKYTAQYRPDAKGDFQTAAQGKIARGENDQVSIQCYNGPEDAEHWIRFDDFRIVKLAE